MSFRDLNISTCYESNEQKTQLLDNFYIPVLEQSVKYYRIAGYFSSSALSVVAEGIEGLIKNNGKMYLLISPELSTEDYQIRSYQNMECLLRVQVFSAIFLLKELKMII